MKEPNVDGAVAMAGGVVDLDVDTETNIKLARIPSRGKPLFAIQIDTETLHIGIETRNLTAAMRYVDHDIRRFGYDLSGNPASLDEAWLLIKAM